MTYARAWTQTRRLTGAEWYRLIRCFDGIRRMAGVDLAGPLGTGRPVATYARIAFNGARDLGEDYETFALEPTPKDYRCCCKTARQPYDAVVAAVLMAAERIAPGAFADIASDGGPEDWAEADAICDYLGLRRRRSALRVGGAVAETVRTGVMG